VPDEKLRNLVETHWADKSFHSIRNNATIEFPLHLSNKSSQVDINRIGEIEGLTAIAGIGIAQGMPLGLEDFAARKQSFMNLEGNINV
jgi:hypothetical protein